MKRHLNGICHRAGGFGEEVPDRLFTNCINVHRSPEKEHDLGPPASYEASKAGNTKLHVLRKAGQVRLTRMHGSGCKLEKGVALTVVVKMNPP